ncbi:MAG: hypothetical protein D6744_07475 [Planctomycetota bacterium]|nr:MAG: hypothetical protein D6744_07475 [Planctomycetota bacterium]
MFVVTSLTISGVAFQLGGCNPFSGIGRVLNTTNPCGTLLNCDPAAYQFVRSGISGPGEGFDVDPFCTFPPFCDVTTDPIFGGLAP